MGNGMNDEMTTEWTAKMVAALNRAEQAFILNDMINAEWEGMGPRPKLTAYKVLDKEFSTEAQWHWYSEMAAFLNAQCIGTFHPDGSYTSRPMSISELMSVSDC